MTLLDALLELMREAEGRRAGMRELYAAVGRVAETIGAELRDGDLVEVDGRTVSAVSYDSQGGRRVKTLTVDDRLLGEKTGWDTMPRASLADHRWFAQHAQEVFTALSRQLQRDKRRLKSDRILIEADPAREEATRPSASKETA